VSFFVLSPEIEDRDEVEVAIGQSTKRSALNDIIILFYLPEDYKKIGHELIYFLLVQLR
jgi:hypothetical protein